jgi:hypothetical protein
VENEYLFSDELLEFRNFYEFTKTGKIEKDEEKKKDEKSKDEKESDRFKLIVRAQLVTSDSKTDTYYATDNNNSKIVFVKGPYKDDKVPKVVSRIINIKKVLGLPVIDVIETPELYPDMFDIKTGLGIRRKLKKGKYPFIVFENIIEEKLPIMKKDHTVKWPATNVVDFSKLKTISHLDEDKLDEKMKLDYVKLVYFRQIIGCGDLANRNFLVKNNIIYSIDEDVLFKEIDIDKQIRKNTLKKMINDITLKYKDELVITLKTWKQKLIEKELMVEFFEKKINMLIKKLK